MTVAQLIKQLQALPKKAQAADVLNPYWSYKAKETTVAGVEYVPPDEIYSIDEKPIFPNGYVTLR